MTKKVGLELAVEIAKRIQDVVTYYNANVALTGGTLYKIGERKDVDFVVYPHKDDLPFEPKNIIEALKDNGFNLNRDWGRVAKMYDHRSETLVDILFPGREGIYPTNK